MSETWWQETEENVAEVHAYFGGKVCWLKNGENVCGKPSSDPIHKIEYPECEHVYICEKCGDELPVSLKSGRAGSGE